MLAAWVDPGALSSSAPLPMGSAARQYAQLLQLPLHTQQPCHAHMPRGGVARSVVVAMTPLTAQQASMCQLVMLLLALVGRSAVLLVAWWQAWSHCFLLWCACTSCTNKSRIRAA